MATSLKFGRETLGADLSAALTVALVSIPNGMAYALVAGERLAGLGAVVDPIRALFTIPLLLCGVTS
jgi:MFS superfamily sulfate permease-like transporter